MGQKQQNHEPARCSVRMSGFRLSRGHLVARPGPDPEFGLFREPHFQAMKTRRAVARDKAEDVLRVQFGPEIFHHLLQRFFAGE